MAGNRLVLDANIVLYMLGGDETLITFLEGRQGYLSVITELELIGYPDLETEELSRIQAFLASCRIIEINDSIRSFYTSLCHRYRLKLGDAAAAATALYLNLPFMSADKGFQKVAELELMFFNPTPEDTP